MLLLLLEISIERIDYMIINLGAIFIAFLTCLIGWTLYFHFIEPAFDKWLDNRKNKCYNDDNEI